MMVGDGSSAPFAFAGLPIVPLATTSPTLAFTVARNALLQDFGWTYIFSGDSIIEVATCTVTGTIYIALNGTNAFNPLAAANGSPLLTPATVSQTVVTAQVDDLALPVAQGDRLLLVVSMSCDAAEAEETTGGFSGGLTLGPEALI